MKFCLPGAVYADLNTPAPEHQPETLVNAFFCKPYDSPMLELSSQQKEQTGPGRYGLLESMPAKHLRLALMLDDFKEVPDPAWSGLLDSCVQETYRQLGEADWAVNSNQWLVQAALKDYLAPLALASLREDTLYANRQPALLAVCSLYTTRAEHRPRSFFDRSYCIFRVALSAFESVADCLTSQAQPYCMTEVAAGYYAGDVPITRLRHDNQQQGDNH